MTDFGISYTLEEYVKRIYEMPSSWGDQGGMEALKAQAVAARSYALARVGRFVPQKLVRWLNVSQKVAIGKWQ